MCCWYEDKTWKNRKQIWKEKEHYIGRLFCRYEIKRIWTFWFFNIKIKHEQMINVFRQEIWKDKKLFLKGMFCRYENKTWTIYENSEQRNMKREETLSWAPVLSIWRKKKTKYENFEQRNVNREGTFLGECFVDMKIKHKKIWIFWAKKYEKRRNIISVACFVKECWAPGWAARTLSEGAAAASKMK